MTRIELEAEIEDTLRKGHWHSGTSGNEKPQKAAIPEDQLEYYAEPILSLFDKYLAEVIPRLTKTVAGPNNYPEGYTDGWSDAIAEIRQRGGLK